MPVWENLPSLKLLADRSVLILGLGREGWSTAQFFHQYFPQINLVLADEKTLTQLSADWTPFITETGSQWYQLPENVPVSLHLTNKDLGEHGPSFPSRSDHRIGLIVKTPGIPPDKLT